MHVGWCRISSINRTKGYRDWPTFPVPKKKRRHRILNPSEIPAFTVCSDLPNHHRLPGSNHSEITMLWVPKRKHQQKKRKAYILIEALILMIFCSAAIWGFLMCCQDACFAIGPEIRWCCPPHRKIQPGQKPPRGWLVVVTGGGGDDVSTPT